MAYDKKQWFSGETITASKLNRIENGIDDLDKSTTNLANSLDDMYFDTCAEMQASTTLKSGMICQTAGYYAVNDGGGAMYRISSSVPTSYYETLSNSLYAELIVEDHVSYRRFGAKLDGVSDDSAAVVAAHAYANAHGLPVVESGGSLYMNFSVVVKTSCYLDINMIIDENCQGHAYYIMPDEYTDLTYTGSMSAGAHAIQAPLNALYGKSAEVTCENNTWSLGNRSGTPEDPNEKWHQQVIAYDEQGYCISSGLYTENTGTFQFTYVQSLAMKAIEFSGPNVITKFTDHSVNFKTLVRCFRNNTTIRNITVRNKGTVQTAQLNNRGSLIAVRHCANCIIENVDGLNNSYHPYPAATTEFSPYSYVYEVGPALNITLRNINVSQGWGAGATFFVDGFYIENSNISRVDNHYGCFGVFSIRNCIFNGVNCVNLGYGDATVVIDGCRFHNVHRDNGRAIKSRGDFDIKFSGRLDIRDCVFDCSTSDTPIYIHYNFPSSGNFPHNQPEIYMRGVKHIVPASIDKAYTFATDVDDLTITDSMVKDNRMVLTVSDSVINGVALLYGGTFIMSNSIMPKASKIRASNIFISGSIIKTDEFPMVLRKDSTRGISHVNDCVFEFINSKPAIRQTDATPFVVSNCDFVGSYDDGYIVLGGTSDRYAMYNCRTGKEFTIQSGSTPNVSGTLVLPALLDLSIDDYISKVR